MAPFYRGFTTNVKLASDDIEAIQELYGEKTTEFVKHTKRSHSVYEYITYSAWRNCL